MKIYNPFKTHVVPIGDFWYVRKLTLLGFMYLYIDDDGTCIWYNSHSYHHCRLASLFLARKTIEEAKFLAAIE